MAAAFFAFILCASIAESSRLGTRARCGPGRGGDACEFGADTIFYDHQPYDGLELRSLDLQGWTPGAEVYLDLCKRVKAQTIVEVGVWKGASAAHLAGYLKSRHEGVLFAVDTWTGALEFWDRRFTKGAYDEQRDLQFVHGYPSVYTTFLSNMVRSRLSSYVVPFPVTSRLAAEFFEEKAFLADLVHIDAAHEEQDAKDDIERWWPIVRPCGILMGDDYSKYWPGVILAVDAFAARVGVHLEVIGPKWVLRKPCV